MDVGVCVEGGGALLECTFLSLGLGGSISFVFCCPSLNLLAE